MILCIIDEKFKWTIIFFAKFTLPFLKGCLLKLNRAILVWAHKNFVKEIMGHVKEIMGHDKEIILSKKKKSQLHF